MNAETAAKKAALREALFDALTAVPEVISVTLVGSFVDRNDLAGISDIDTIVIVDRLDAAVFTRCQAAVQAIDPSSVGFPGLSIRINASFGPLKFDSAGQIVVHLMVYDRAGHLRHVIKSPFTCLDWERSSLRRGPALAQIARVGCLQPRDFLSGRRGMADYRADLEKSEIGYRVYEFDGGCAREVKRSFSLDDRHRGEYAYHIVRNLALNALKLFTRDNALPQSEALIPALAEYLPGIETFAARFATLARLKQARSTAFPSDTVAWAATFIADFQDRFARHWQSAHRVVFVRHAHTPLNDGSFLGQGRDPGLADPAAVAALGTLPVAVWSSPARRAMETAERLAPGLRPTCDPRLSEIDYGAVEGLYFQDLAERFPELVTRWEAGEDPEFPDGESQGDVLVRLHAFLESLGATLNATQPGEQLIVTHQVVLRCLLGSALGLPRRTWHRMRIPHLQPLEFLCRKGHWYPNVDRDILMPMLEPLIGAME